MVVTKKQGKDGERITKLEYVVYEHHGPTLQEHKEAIRVNTKNTDMIILHLRGIKRTFYAFCIGYTLNQVAGDSFIDILKLIN